MQRRRGKMQNTLTSLLGFLVLFSSASQQERPRELKGAGHLLGETAERFFSEDAVGQLLLACQAGDWKAVKQLAKAVNPASKPNAKDICSNAALVKQQATSGARQEHGGGDDKTMRSDAFTLYGGHLVGVDLVFNVSTTDVEGDHPKHLAEIFEGMRVTYRESI